MKTVRVVSVFAMFAAAGLVTTGCEGFAGPGNGNTAADAGTLLSGPDGTGAVGNATPDASGEAKTIRVRFEVTDGGPGFVRTWGITGANDLSCLVKHGDWFGNHFVIPVTVPAAEKRLNIYFKSLDKQKGKGYLEAVLGITDAGEYVIGIAYDYFYRYGQARRYFITKNLRRVNWYFPENDGDEEYFWEPRWNDLWNRAAGYPE